MSQPFRSSAVIAIALVIMLTSVIQRGAFQESEGGPSAEDCEDHIQAAIKDFVASGRVERSTDEIGSQTDDSGTSNEESDEVVGDVRRSPTDEQEEESQKIVNAIEDVIQVQHDDDENSSEEAGDKKESDSKEDGGDGEDTSAEEAEAESPGVEVTDTEEENEDGSEERGDVAEDVDESGERGESKEDENSAERDFQEIHVDESKDGGEREEESDQSHEEDQENSSSSEAKDEQGSSEETDRRDRRDAEPSAAHTEQSDADDTADEKQEGAIEGSDAADVTETSDGDAGHSTTEQPEESDQEEKDESAETSDSDNDVDDEVISAGPGALKPRDKIDSVLGSAESETAADLNQERVANEILKDVKKMYENAVKPLEQLYKFKDISNRHMGDAEIFSKPMILFMGPWSTGKSAIINYLLGTEFSRSALKTGAEPTSNSFTVITYGETDQALDGTQIAADWAFSTLQKFGETFLERLKGRKLSNRLLQKMTIVDTPGVIENRKSPAERQRYPFNDAFQWFIDRADLIYVVFDPSKLDVGPELEALFDQLKGRESHVRILLNKADTVKPRELMKVQGTLLWNLSPEMGTSEAPTVFVGSFWSRPYLPGSPITLLDAQEEAFLEDLADALDSRVETKVALARRHAVRVRNHAKMVDCYLKTYYEHKSFFGNRRKVADEIVDNPHEYRIYEGLSTMNNVSRYDLPDPDVYREFFRLHPLFDFKPLASTCSYFKGCPLDKLDIVIAYDLPELVSKYQKLLSGRPTVAGTTTAPPLKGKH